MGKVLKPTPIEVRALAKCFPSSSTTKKSGFDPNADCVVIQAQKKKKAAIKGKQRPISITVVMLRSYLPTVPKGKMRKNLASEGRIQNIGVTRDMTNLQVRNKIVRAFGIASFSFLEVDSTGRLVKISCDSFNGEAAAQHRGSLYVYETQV